jgi:hypothetical protein
MIVEEEASRRHPDAPLAAHAAAVIIQRPGHKLKQKPLAF